MSDYTPTGVPVTDSAGASSEIRAEFALIQTAIATKLESGDAIGTPASGTLTNCTGLPAAGVVGTALVAAAIGTTVQAYDADLTTWAGVTPGAGVATALAVAVGSAGAPVTFNGAGGTPSSLVGTNITGTAAGLTAGAATLAASVTTNANLTGHVTSVGNAAVLGSFTLAQLNTAISDGDVAAAASQADQETATSTTTYVSPGRQQFHPSAAKGWVHCGVSGDVNVSYNVASVTDTGAGQITVNWATDFSGASYSVHVSPIVTVGGSAATTYVGTVANTLAAGTTLCTCTQLSGYANTDPNAWAVTAYGDQA